MNKFSHLLAVNDNIQMMKLLKAGSLTSCSSWNERVTA
jgi:hypothetical protein